MDLREVLKERRSILGISQLDLAEMAGISLATNLKKLLFPLLHATVASRLPVLVVFKLVQFPIIFCISLLTASML